MSSGATIGELFDGRYRLERKCGSGGMADVYLATDESLGRSVAIKILSDRYAQDDGFVERFRREASAAAGLNHPNIVSVYDRGEAEGTYYIAMEYLDGPTLKDEILRRAPLPEAEAIGWATQVLDALDFAHRRGVIHRDVKPHNMMITDGRLKVTDFGIARAGNTQQMTEVGSIVGTAQYLSPEQARGMPVGPQSDLYSVGIVLYEMLTGELPFTGDGAVDIAMKQVSDPVPPLRARNRLVSPALEQVVMRALAKDPALRYASARAMADELRRVARGGVVSADTLQATQVISTAPTAVTTVLPPPDERQAPKRSIWPWALVIALLIAAAAIGYAVYRELSPSGTKVTSGLVGLTCNQAKAALSNDGLHGRCTPKQSSTANRDLVVSTNPAAGHSVPSGSTVTIFIGAGPKTVKVPAVAGKSLSDAIAALQTAGFTTTPAEANVNSFRFPVGTVTGSTPKAGTVEPPTKKITLQVSNGQVKVPNVSGDSCTEAQAALTALTLRGTCVSQTSNSTPSGEAIGTSPGAGLNVAQHTPVQILVSTGPASVNVPSVVGMSRQDAKQTLTNQGFHVAFGKDVINCTDPTSDRTVASQSPSQGSAAPVGSTVTLDLYRFDPNDPSCTPPGSS
jgi:beta-lactam-binding protein with PASTA domain